jgi:hypothetical protein
MDAPPAATSASAGRAPATAVSRPARTPRRARLPEGPLDAEALIRGVITKLTQGDAETEHLRDAMGKAVDVLRAAIG